MTWDKAFWKAALVRAAKTVCQTAVATIGTTAAVEQVDWKLVVSASLLAGILSILTSIGGLPEVGIESKEEVPFDLLEDEKEEEDE